PSAYLQMCCPACFGGAKPQLKLSSLVADVLVCLDGNFTQKCLKGKYDDPTLIHPESHFLPEDDLLWMEERVDAIRTKRHGLWMNMGKLPDEVLDECEKSFIAAHEKIAKASSKHFADTGLMGMLCR
ncbi:hypothetical protein M422DRAFT_80059, partial [Sphaerobolus stellatus SS14]